MATSKGSFSLLYMVIALLSCASSLKEITKTGCGKTKGCFSMPASGCDSSKNCDYLVTYVKKNDQIEFEMSSKSKWAAIGFNSAGGKMVGTDAILCTTLTSGIAIQHYNLTSKSLPAKTSPTPTELTLNATSSEGGRTLCRFSRKITGSGKLKSLNEKLFLVVGHGSVTGNVPQYHGQDKATSQSAIDLQSDFNVAAGFQITKTGCGTTKGCFSMPESGCNSSKNCDYLVTYSKKNDQIEFEMSTKSKWAAIGFNSEAKMPGTDAVLCVTLSSGIAIQHYDLTAKSLPGKTNPTPTELTLNATSSEGGRTLCRFSRKITGSGKLKSLNQKWFLVVGHGSVTGNVPQYHGQDKTTSQSAIDVQSDFNVAAGETKMVLVKSHGTLMTIAWMCFVAIGIFMARYMKLMWADQLICGQKVWFVFHRTLVTLGVLFSVIAIILIFVHREGWSEGIGWHPYTGIITVALAIVNPIMALFRPHPGEPKRPIFNWAHRSVGLAAFGLAVLTIYLAVYLKQLNIKDSGLPVIITFCVGWFVVVIFHAVLYVRSQNKDSQLTPGTQGKGVEQMQEEQPTTNSTDNTIRFIAFGFWVLVAVATTVALAVIINVK